MSSTLHVCSIDLDALRRIQGSRDEELLALLLERGAGALADHDAYFAKFPQVTNYTPLARALGQIVRGRIDPALAPRFQFEHAAALIANLIGEPLDAGAFAERPPALRDEVDVTIQRALQAAGRAASSWPALATILQRGPALDVPLDPSWPLGSGHLAAPEVQAAWLAARSCDLDSLEAALDDLAWPDDAIEGARQYRDWLAHAAGVEQGLFLHG